MVKAKDDSEWLEKGATLSHVTARKEFGLTEGEVVAAIREGRLQWREDSAHGNPYFRLLRREVEALMKRRHGGAWVADRKVETEVARIDRELRRLSRQIAKLQERRAQLTGSAAPDTEPGRGRR